MKFFLAASALLGLVAAVPASAPIPAELDTRHLLSCPKNGNLPKNYVKPSLVVNVSKKHPNAAYGSTKVPSVTPNDFCTIFNLELPPSAYDKMCNLVFLFPNHWQTVNPYIYKTKRHGGGHFQFIGYNVTSGATEETTYNHQPEPGPSPPNPPPTMSPGHAYVINSAPCGFPPGLKEPVLVSGMLCSPDTTFEFFQSDKKCPLGFFVELLPIKK